MEFRLQALKNKVSNLAVELGGPLVEGFIAVTAPVIELIKSFARFQEFSSEASKSFIRTATRISLITVAVVGLILAFKALMFLGLGTAVGAIGAAIGALMSPLGLVVAAIALIGVAAVNTTEVLPRAPSRFRR